MAEPFRLYSTGNESIFSEEESRQQLIRSMLQDLTRQAEDMNTYRNYFEGEQDLVYGTTDYKDKLNEAYPELRFNWCEVVVEAPADKITMQKVVFLEDEEPTNLPPESDIDVPPDPRDVIDNDLTDSIWRIFRENNIDVQQDLVHEGMLVEGRCAVIVWPDPELDARFDFQPGQNVYVRYADDDWRTPVAAIKRWQVNSGEVYITLYTPQAVYKYREPTSHETVVSGGRRDRIISPSAPSNTFIPREVEGELWPLPNPLNKIPVVEFIPPRGSKLKNFIAIQNSINLLMANSLFGAENAGWGQRGFHTGAKEPEGGWDSRPGRVWHLPPVHDAEGKLHFGKEFEFQSVDLSQFKQSIDTVLQQAALLSKTPMRYFFHSDRGGRGDAPSGDSLLVSDDALIEYIEKFQKVAAWSWVQVAILIGESANLITDTSPLADVSWLDPRARYRTSLLEEAKIMAEIGVPLKFIATYHLGLSTDETKVLIAMLEEEERKREEEEEELRRQADQTVAVEQETTTTPTSTTTT